MEAWCDNYKGWSVCNGPGGNSCSPIPGRSCWEAGTVLDNPHGRLGALLGRAASPALLAQEHPNAGSSGGKWARTQPPLPAPTCPTASNLLALGASPLCHRALLNLPEVY